MTTTEPSPGMSREPTACRLRSDERQHVYSARERKQIRKYFDTLGAARTWREDAAGAVRQGPMRAPRATTLEQAATVLIAGMGDARSSTAAVARTSRRPHGATSVSSGSASCRSWATGACRRSSGATSRCSSSGCMVMGLPPRRSRTLSTRCR